jgi:hypothetical protein
MIKSTEFQVNNYGPVPAENHWNMEAIFLPEIFRWVPVNFLCFPAGTGRKSSENFRPEYCFHVSAISGVFLRDTLPFPRLSCRFLHYPLSGIIDLGDNQ